MHFFRVLRFRGRKRRLRFANQALILASLGLVVLVPSSALAFYLFERNPNENVGGYVSALKWVTLTLLQAQAAFDVKTAGGTGVFYIVLIGGVGLIAMATAALASKLVELVVKRGAGLGSTKEKGHIVVCGWSSKGEEILRELHADEVEDKRPVVILAPLERTPTRDPLVEFISGYPTKTDDLSRAGIERADTAIILADDSTPGLLPDDVDGRTLLTTLAVESVNPSVYSCVEVLRAENRIHFERTKADELVVSAELTGALLAISAVEHGLSHVVSDLITHPVGNEFYSIRPPEAVVGRTFQEALSELKRTHDCVLVAVRTGEARYEINPPSERLLSERDQLLVIAQTDSQLS